MGGTAATASCNCASYYFETQVSTGSTITYKPCNAEGLVVETYAANINTTLCVADDVFQSSNSLRAIDTANPCLQANCQSCDCYEYFYKISVDGPAYLSYIPCNAPSSSREIIGPLSALSTGSFLCSFPWMVQNISGNLDYGTNGPTGVIKLVNSGSCQPIPSGSIEVGDLRGGGQVLWVQGTYPNQSGLIMTTQSVATSSANMSRWGFYGTVTNINNRAYGSGASNTQALRNYIPATGSIAANALTASINGYSDWFLPSEFEAITASYNGIVWPSNVRWTNPTRAVPNAQPQFWINTNGNSVLTSTEKYDGTTAQRQVYARQVSYPFNPNDRDKNLTALFYGVRYFTSSLVP